MNRKKMIGKEMGRFQEPEAEEQDLDIENQYYNLKVQLLIQLLIRTVRRRSSLDVVYIKLSHFFNVHHVLHPVCFQFVPLAIKVTIVLVRALITIHNFGTLAFELVNKHKMNESSSSPVLSSQARVNGQQKGYRCPQGHWGPKRETRRSSNKAPAICFAIRKGSATQTLAAPTASHASTFFPIFLKWFMFVCGEWGHWLGRWMPFNASCSTPGWR
uniref:Uncharacterized protein n=1 Tax=Helianthus annuus TaxID=4232 RepID=A0A251UDW6_HELAN